MAGTTLESPQLKTSQPHSFQLEDYEGPLDVLLYLIKKNEVSIYDIPIGSITEQYLTWLSSVEEHSLDDLSEFYDLAVTLVYLKSRMLLPVQLSMDDELEDPRRDLVEKLIEYQKYKKLTDLMQAKEAESDWYLERRRIPKVLPVGQEDTLWEEIEIWDLVKSFSQIMKNLSSDKLLSLYEEVSVNEKIALIYEFIETKIEFPFEDLIRRPGSVLDLICAFLAILECAKARVVMVIQHKLFGDIRLRARPSDGGSIDV